MTARSTKNGPLLGTYIFRQCLAVFCLLSSLGGKQSSLSLVSAQSCIDNFYEIYEKEALVTDTTFNRLYIICPRRIYEIATLDFNGNIREPQSSGVFPPLPLRSNITIRCGDQGSREDLCWLTGGDLHMDGTNVLGLAEETIENVSIEGFVFIGARKHSLWAAKPGSIFFRDCEWKDFVNSQVPIMLDYYDVLNPSKKLVTTFSDCEFRNNRYFGMGSQTALIYSNSVQNTVVVQQSLFENNDMIFNNTRPDTHSFIIESLGPTVIENTCFQNNLVGTSDVVVFGSSFSSRLNFATNSSGTLCSFSSVFETIQQFDAFTPLCVDATAISCVRYETSSPTASPSSAPTPVISASPSVPPTSQPTTTPYPSPMPSMAPSLSPTEPGETRPPSLAPVEFTWPDTEAPSAASSGWFTGQRNVTLFLLGAMAYYCLVL